MTTETAIRCEGSIRTEPSDYGFQSVRCGQTVGIHRWHDASGVEHAACIWHVRDLERRYPVGEPAWLHEDPDFAPDPIDAYKSYTDAGWTEAELREAHGG